MWMLPVTSFLKYLFFELFGIEAKNMSPQQTIVKKMNIDTFSHINKSALPDTSKSDNTKEDRNIWHGILSLVRLQREISASKMAPIAIYCPEKRQNHRALKISLSCLILIFHFIFVMSSFHTICCKCDALIWAGLQNLF